MSNVIRASRVPSRTNLAMAGMYSTREKLHRCARVLHGEESASLPTTVDTSLQYSSQFSASCHDPD